MFNLPIPRSWGRDRGAQGHRAHLSGSFGDMRQILKARLWHYRTDLDNTKQIGFN